MVDVAPRPEDFGIRPGELESAPTPFLTGHRVAAIGVLYLLVVGVVFTALAVSSGSPAAAGYLTLVLVAAASVLLLPLAVCLVCAAERAETRWLCRRAPGLAACLAYREAVAAWRDRRATARATGWTSLSRPALAARLADMLRRSGAEVVATPSGWDTGYDLAIERDARTILVRCVAGREPAAEAVGRELIGLLAGGAGDEAVVVAPGGAGSGLQRLLDEWPIRVVAELELDALTLVADQPGRSEPPESAG